MTREGAGEVPGCMFLDASVQGSSASAVPLYTKLEEARQTDADSCLWSLCVCWL